VGKKRGILNSTTLDLPKKDEDCKNEHRRTGSAGCRMESTCSAPPDAGASTGNDDDHVGFFCHDFPPEK